MEKIIALKDRIKNISLFLDTIDASGINRLEKDILMQKVRELYLEVIDLNEKQIVYEFKPEANAKAQIIKKEEPVVVKFSNNPEPVIEKPEPVKVPVVEVAPKVIAEINPMPQDDFLVEFVDNIDEEPVIIPEPINLEQTLIISEPIPVEQPVEEPVLITATEVVAKKPVVEQPTLFHGSSTSGIKTVGEQLGQNKTSLNEMLASKNNASDFSSRLKPLTDIKSAIGVGDRFLYIRELFGGNNDAFEETIVHLNSLSSFHDAQTYLASKFNWDESQTTVSTFVNIVKRRYV